jgi:hypothetical protein
MIPSLMHLSIGVLGKYFLSMESLRYIPHEIVDMIFREYLSNMTSPSAMDDNDLNRTINLLTEYHADAFCSSLCYSKVNHGRFLTAPFYLHLLKCLKNTLNQLDFSNALDKFNVEEKAQLLNIVGQMETLEYLRLTHNRFDDDDIRLLTASHRIQSKALCNLRYLHLQGENNSIRQYVHEKYWTVIEIHLSILRSDVPIDSVSNSSKFDLLMLELVVDATCQVQWLVAIDLLFSRRWSHNIVVVVVVSLSRKSSHISIGTFSQVVCIAGCSLHL